MAESLGSLLFGPEQPRSGRTVNRLDDDVYQVDQDGDHVYVVTVQRIPRVRLLPDEPIGIGEVDGIGVELVAVNVANSVEVVLDAAPGAARDAADEAFRAGYQRWEQHANAGAPPPPWPAERVNRIAITVGDDRGTPYRFAWGSVGGTATEWRCHRTFRPVPPPDAGRLALAFALPDGRTADLELAIPDSAGH